MSLVFYAWGEPVYVLVMLGSIVLNYTAGLLIHIQRRQAKKKRTFFTEKTIVVLCITANLGLLIYFKYTNFIIQNVNAIFQDSALAPIVYPHVILPIGISFFTFQAMSYVIDVYRKETDVQLNIANLALYVTMFPQLIAGPIVRYHDVAKQIATRIITREQFSSGVQRFIFGLSKKIILANPLGEIADKVFAVPVHDLPTSLAWLGITCFTLQIYFDFSGYSDMAIGLGRLFGFEFLENFNFPYIAQSIREFWRRWHISLSTWFRDYLYIPLGGSHGSSLKTYLNLWVVFCLCGLWHGASWNFLIWGAFHGMCLIVERLRWVHVGLARMWKPIRHVYVMLVVIVGWVFFRAESLIQAVQYVASMIGLTRADGVKYYASFYLDPKTIFTLLAACILATPISGMIFKRLQIAINASRSETMAIVSHAGYYCMLVILFCLSAAYLAAGTYNPFIYYRF